MPVPASTGSSPGPASSGTFDDLQCGSFRQPGWAQSVLDSADHQLLVLVNMLAGLRSSGPDGSSPVLGPVQVFLLVPENNMAAATSLVPASEAQHGQSLSSFCSTVPGQSFTGETGLCHQIGDLASGAAGHHSGHGLLAGTSQEGNCFNIGLDTFGPCYVSARKTRGGLAQNKRWAVIVTSMSVRAVHIEVVESLDTSSFINALQCFLAICVPVAHIRSDQGTNLVGACKSGQL